MPWEADGRSWHTRGPRRPQRRAVPLGRPHPGRRSSIASRSWASSAETDWSERSVVEIAAAKKTDGWFFHAITGEPWLLKLKFRVCQAARSSATSCVERLELKPLNELPDLPIYGNEPRVKCKNLRGPWQEVQFAVHSLDEIDTPAFWKFLEDAVAGFQKFTQRMDQSPEDIMPWKVLGQKWHFSRKGFPPGKHVDWPAEVLEELCELLSDGRAGRPVPLEQPAGRALLRARRKTSPGPRSTPSGRKPSSWP